MPRRPRPTTSRRSLSLIPALILAVFLVLIPAASGARSSSETASQIKSCKRRYAGNGKKKRAAEKRCVRKAREAARHHASSGSPSCPSKKKPAESGTVDRA
jgi:hypothetical protein